MRPLWNVVALTAAVIALTCESGTASAAQRDTHREWLRSDSGTKTAAAGAGSSALFTKSVLVLVLVAGGGYLVWRRTKQNKPPTPVKRGHVRVLSGTPIGPKARAVVAEVGGRLILLGVTEHSVRRLAWLDSDPADDSEQGGARSTREPSVREDPPIHHTRAQMEIDSKPLALRGSTFSEVLRDAVGLKPRPVAGPAAAIAEVTRDRVVLKGKPAKEHVSAERSEEHFDIEGQAAGLVARLNRRT